MNTKRRRRKTVLDVNTAESFDLDTSNKVAKYHKTNKLSGNSLTHLLEQYNSDSDDDTPRTDKTGCLNEKVNDFFKEIQYIGSDSEELRDKSENTVSKNKKSHMLLLKDSNASSSSSSMWQECFDESTGYPYYWHTETNQVTWEVPMELKLTRNYNEATVKKLPDKDPLRDCLLSSSQCGHPDLKFMSTIPEGMIPKDIVARNRLKQVGSESYLTKDKTKMILDKRKKSEMNDEDSSDGRIEMITSFGSDNSNSDYSDNGQISPYTSKNIAAKMKIGKLQRKDISNGVISNYNNDDNHDSHNEDDNNDEENNNDINVNNDDVGNNNEDDEDVNDDDDDHDDHDTDDENNANDDDNDDDDDVDIANEVIDKSKSNDKIHPRTNIQHDNKLAFSLVPGYADESDNEENPAIKTKIVEPLFPITPYKNSQVNERSSKIDSNSEESGCLGTLDDSFDTLNADDTKIKIKIDETLKTNRLLENSITSTKVFQRKKRIAFDFSTQNYGKFEGENLTQSQFEDMKNSGTILPIIRGNDCRHGLGFSKAVSADGNDQDCHSLDDMTLHFATPIEGKKDNLLGKSIGFVRGETLMLTKNIEEFDNCTMIDGIQTIVEKLKFLSEGSSAATAVQIMNIQLQTLMSAWESKDLKNRYFFNWLMGTNRELSRLEKAAAPPGWNCQWDRLHKRYYYRNEINGETRWSYPDIIGGAEEMELCTTPPPPDVEEKINEAELNIRSNKNLAQNQHIHTSENKYEPKKSQYNANGVDDQHYGQEKVNSINVQCQRDEMKTNKILESRISSPSPPPPPRISGDDLTKNRRKRKDNERNQANAKIVKKDETKINKIDGIEESDSKKINIIAATTTKVILNNCEPVIASSQRLHLLTSNSTHGEPLPPGVDHPEMPYTITASATIEPSVIFSAAASQTNASIYAATMQDPTNISLLGHHHPALIQNQLVHYPTYHPHLQNQAIIAAANNLAGGPDTVQFMLDYTRIYTNTQVIAKPPVKTNKEPLGTVLDSFYNDIASLESDPVVDKNQMKPLKYDEMATSVPMKLKVSPAIMLEPPTPPKTLNTTSTDSTFKDKKKKKVKIVISKKQKQVSSMVAKWKKAQNYEGIN